MNKSHATCRMSKTLLKYERNDTLQIYTKWQIWREVKGDMGLCMALAVSSNLKSSSAVKYKYIKWYKNDDSMMLQYY